MQYVPKVAGFIQYRKHFYCHKNSFQSKYIIEKSIVLLRFVSLESKTRIACNNMINFYIIVYLFRYNNIVDGCKVCIPLLKNITYAIIL